LIKCKVLSEITIISYCKRAFRGNVKGIVHSAKEENHGDFYEKLTCARNRG